MHSTANPVDRTVGNGDITLAISERGMGSTVILLHGLAGSSRELLATADALSDEYHVVLLDQRGHGKSTRRPRDVSRAAFVADVLAVIAAAVPSGPVALVGQSMGAHTAFLVAAQHPELVSQLILLEGHPGGSDDPEDATRIGAYFAAWPESFTDEEDARAHLGDSALARAWIADLARGDDGLLRPRFDADVMQRTIEAVHEPRWAEWEALTVPTLAVFADAGMFTTDQQAEVVRRRPTTRTATIPDAGHDAHLDNPVAWTQLLRRELHHRNERRL